MKIVARLLPSLALCLVGLFTAAPASAADGLITLKSPYPANETMNRFEEAAKQRGLMVFARIDHAAGATRIGKTLRPTEVLMFGNPQGGTPFIECAQSVGIDLPLKALVCWSGKTRRGRSGLPTTTPLGSRAATAPPPALRR